MLPVDLSQFKGKCRLWNPHAAVPSGRSLLPIIIKETQDHDVHEVDVRIMAGAPLVAIHTNAESHPAAVYDLSLARMISRAVWEAGGVAYVSTQPTVCDGIAQEHDGMKYSLASRNRMARVFNEVMNALGCNAAIVLQTCDKQPSGAIAGAVLCDRTRQKQGHEPLSVVFLPAPVMKPGPYTERGRAEIERLIAGCETRGDMLLRDRLKANYAQTNTAVKGIIDRTIFLDIVQQHPDLLNERQMADLEHELLPDQAGSGGMCAFNGTANSSRNVATALGLVPEGFDLLSGPYTEEMARQAVNTLFTLIQKRIGITRIVRENLSLGVKFWSATGGSTNLALHLPFVMTALGMEGNLDNLLAIRGDGVPDLFDLKVEYARSFWELAQQVRAGHHSGSASLVKAMHKLRIIGDQELDAMTVSGTWRERVVAAKDVAQEPKGQQIYLTAPETPTSGIQKVEGNLGRSAVIKISGVRREKIALFHDKVFMALMYLSEEDATAHIARRKEFFSSFVSNPDVSTELLTAMAVYNLRLQDKGEIARLRALPKDALVEEMLKRNALMIMVTIGGVGIKAIGMPEMCHISHDIMYNPMLADTCLLLTDGRISGTNKGFVIVHNEPEAYERGPILGVRNGDLAHLSLDDTRNTQYLNLIDPQVLLKSGKAKPLSAAAVKAKVDAVAEERLAKIDAVRALLEPMLLDDLTAMSNAYTGGASAAMLARVGKDALA
jgi:dihydroxyacid dehydratase/phosphogluconate dehydratase